MAEVEVVEVDAEATTVEEEAEVEEVVHSVGVVGAEEEGVQKETEMTMLADNLTSDSCK